MALFTLFSNNHGCLATDHRVCTADEFSPVAEAVESARLLGELLAERKQTIATAIDEATREAYSRGAELARQNADEALQRRLIQLEQEHHRRLQQQREACADLAIAIVQRIADGVASADWLYAQAQQAARELTSPASGIELHVSTAEAEAIRTQWMASPGLESPGLESPELQSSGLDSPIVKIVGDENLPAGACILSTATGKVDVGLKTQLHKVRSLLSDPEGTGVADDG